MQMHLRNKSKRIHFLISNNKIYYETEKKFELQQVELQTSLLKITKNIINYNKSYCNYNFI